MLSLSRCPSKKRKKKQSSSSSKEAAKSTSIVAAKDNDNDDDDDKIIALHRERQKRRKMRMESALESILNKPKAPRSDSLELKRMEQSFWSDDSDNDYDDIQKQKDSSGEVSARSSEKSKNALAGRDVNATEANSDASALKRKEEECWSDNVDSDDDDIRKPSSKASSSAVSNHSSNKPHNVQVDRNTMTTNAEAGSGLISVSSSDTSKNAPARDAPTVISEASSGVVPDRPNHKRMNVLVDRDTNTSNSEAIGTSGVVSDDASSKKSIPAPTARVAAEATSEASTNVVSDRSNNAKDVPVDREVATENSEDNSTSSGVHPDGRSSNVSIPTPALQDERATNSEAVTAVVSGGSSDKSKHPPVNRGAKATNSKARSVAVAEGHSSKKSKTAPSDQGKTAASSTASAAAVSDCPSNKSKDPPADRDAKAAKSKASSHSIKKSKTAPSGRDAKEANSEEGSAMLSGNSSNKSKTVPADQDAKSENSKASNAGVSDDHSRKKSKNVPADRDANAASTKAKSGGTSRRSSKKSKTNAESDRDTTDSKSEAAAAVVSCTLHDEAEEETVVVQKRGRKRGRGLCALCTTCPCRKPGGHDATETLGLQSFSRSDGAMEKALIRRLKKIEKSLESLQDQQETIKRKLKKHRRDILRKRMKAAPENKDGSYFLPDAEELESSEPKPFKAVDAWVLHAQRKMFPTVLEGNQQSLTQLGFMSSKPKQAANEGFKTSSAPFAGPREEKLEVIVEEDSILPSSAENEEDLPASPCQEMAEEIEIPVSDYEEPSRISWRNGSKSASTYSNDLAAYSALEGRIVQSEVQFEEPEQLDDDAYSVLSLTQRESPMGRTEPCPWDKLFADSAMGEDTGDIDQLLQLIGTQEYGTGSIRGVGSPIASQLSQGGKAAVENLIAIRGVGNSFATQLDLSQGGREAVDSLITKVTFDAEKVKALNQVCPNWKENVSFPFVQSKEDNQNALKNLQESRKRLDHTKKLMMAAWNRNRMTMDLFQEALEKCLDRYES